MKRRIDGLKRRLERSPREALAASLALLCAVAAADHALPYDFNLSMLYVAPIFLAARYCSRRAALGISLLAGAVCFTDYLLNLSPWSVTPMARWSLAERFLAFPLIAALFSSLENDALREHEQADKEHRVSLAKSEMLSLVSHQFANSLSVMSLVVGVIDRRDPGIDEERKSELFKTLKRHMSVLKMLVQNFLNEARLSSGRFAIQAQPTDPAEVIQAVLDTLAPLAEKRTISVAVEPLARERRVLADPDALNVVLTNLIGNAIKYTPSDGRICVRVRDAGVSERLIEVSVEDTGIGMTRWEQRKVVGGFARTLAARKAASGFGLGLKVAQDLLRSHGSRLMIESSPGKGSRLWFDLPEASAVPPRLALGSR